MDERIGVIRNYNTICKLLLVDHNVMALLCLGDYFPHNMSRRNGGDSSPYNYYGH